ncbi:MAG: hypothetical protein ACOH5I_20110 [Oligoflexus sp.]
MKFLSILTLANILYTGAVMANGKTVTVKDGSYLGANQISVTFTYTGGCAEHYFQLQMSPICTRSIPQQCIAEIVEPTPVRDDCEALISETKTFAVDEFYTAQDTILKIRSGKDQVYPIELKENVGAAEEAVISSVVLNPINAGINPQAFAYRLNGKIQIDDQTCVEHGIRVQFKQELIGTELVVTATRQLTSKGFVEFCITDASIDLRGFTDQVTAIVLRHVGEFGEDYVLPLQ